MVFEKMRPAAAATANGARDFDQIGVSIGHHLSNPVREIQAIVLAHRFGLMPETAHLVASFAFGGAEW